MARLATDPRQLTPRELLERDALMAEALGWAVPLDPRPAPFAARWAAFCRRVAEAHRAKAS